VAPNAFNRLFFWIAYETDVDDHFLSTLRTLNLHAVMSKPLGGAGSCSQHLKAPQDGELFIPFVVEKVCTVSYPCGFASTRVTMCAELDDLKRDAGLVLRELKRIRRSRDVSFFEDAELNRRKRDIINAVLKHLLVGHDGEPCPAGDRPIVRPAPLRY
jgi:hypothetical protein